MMELSCDPLALTTAVNTLAVSLAARLNDEDLELTAALLVQLGETLETISRPAPPDPRREVAAYCTGPVSSVGQDSPAAI